MSCTYTFKGKTYNAWEFADVLASLPQDELAKFLPESVKPMLSKSDQSNYDLDFAAEVLNELSFEDEAFRYRVSKSKTLEGNMKDTFPGVEYLGEDTRADERTESGADRRFVFAMPKGEQRLFYVYSKGDDVWIDVSRLQAGDQGSAIYHAVANYAFNTGKKFIGDPMGLSEDAVIRRTSAMLSSAIRFGTTEHLGASPEMIRGDVEKGIEPLDWSGDDLAKTKALIHTFVTTLQNQFPSIKNYKYDFGFGEFRDNTGRRVSRERLERGASGSYGRASRAGEASLRRGIFLQSLISSESSEKPGILENILRRSSQLVKQDGGGLDGMLSISFDIDSFRNKLESRLPTKAANAIRDVFTTHKTFNWYHRTLGTQGYKATLSKEYKRVVEATTMYEQDIARIASEAADLAPDLVPKMDSLRSAMEQAKQALNGKDFTAVSPFVFYGTLAEIDLTSPQNIHYLSNPDALIQKYGKLLPEDQKMAALTPHQIELFKQYRAATDKSLDSLATSEMTRLARVSKLQLAEAEMDLKDTANFYFDQVAGEMDTLAERIKELRVEQKAEKKILDQAANDEASNSEKRKTYAKLLMEMSARHKEELDKLKSKMQEFVTLKNGFIDKARKIDELKKKGYAPLMRFGRFTVDVTLKNEAGEVIKDVDGNEMRAFFGMFETESEANAVAREMAQEYPDHSIEQGVLSEHQHELFRSIAPETAEAYAKMMGMESDEAFQKYLKMATSNRDAMRRLINRKGTAGFSFDMTRNLASFITSNARASSANIHMSELIQSVAEIPKGMGDVKDEAIELLNFVRNPQEKGLAIRSLMFFQFLGGSIAAAAVNMTQTFTTTFPYLSQEQFGGATSAGKHIASAMATSASLMRGKTTGDAELDAALKRAVNEGVVAPQEIHMLNGEASRGASMATNNIVWRMMENKYPSLRYSTRLIDAFSSMWGGFFSLAEKYNRQVAFIAAYKMSKEQGKSADEAFKIAEQAVTDTQFNYNKSNRSNFGRGTVGATILTFKTFLINYLEFLKKLPLREQGIALGVLVVLAGAQGLPGADDLDDLIDTIAQAFGGRGNSKEWKREKLASAFGDDAFGKAASNFLLHGVSAFLPLDVSGRLSVGNIIPATGMLKKSDKSFQDDVLEVIGPVGSFVGKGAEFAKSVVGGSNPGSAYMQTVAPKAIADVYKAIDMLQTGAYRDYKGRKIIDTDETDAFFKAIGFQPSSVAEVRRAERMVQQDVSLFRNTKTDITEKWARGVFERDAEKVAKAKAEIAEWNEDNPEWKIVIKPANVQRRVQEMNKLSGERLMKAAPTEIRGNVSSVLKSESLQ